MATKTETAKHPRVQKAVDETPDQFYKDLGDLVDRATASAQSEGGDPAEARQLVLMAAADWIADQSQSSDDDAMASIFG